MRALAGDPSLRLKCGFARDDAEWKSVARGSGRGKPFELRSTGQPRAAVPTWILLLLAAVDQLQRVGLQDALALIARMHRPRARGVELDVGLAVFEGLAWLAGFFEGE